MSQRLGSRGRLRVISSREWAVEGPACLPGGEGTPGPQGRSQGAASETTEEAPWRGQEKTPPLSTCRGVGTALGREWRAGGGGRVEGFDSKRAGNIIKSHFWKSPSVSPTCLLISIKTRLVKTQLPGPYPQSLWFRRPGVGLEN